MRALYRVCCTMANESPIMVLLTDLYRSPTFLPTWQQRSCQLIGGLDYYYQCLNPNRSALIHTTDNCSSTWS